MTREQPARIEDVLERGGVAWFARCPIELPAEDDIEFLRSGIGTGMKAKNLSYHPESDSIPRFDAPPDIRRRAERILRTHGERVAAFWQESLPDFMPGAEIGTTSFRPMEERGRDLKPRSSNELVHIDAGAYGATNGARILRFFVNVHPTRERVWGTMGSFAELMQRTPALWDAAAGGRERVRIRKGPFDRVYSSLIRAASTVYPLFRVIDSSPYDRSMRRIHNRMKEDPAIRDDRQHYVEIHFPPLSAWMVFTDGISHSVLEGKHAFVTTALIPLANSRSYGHTPHGILAARA
jgi:hypothetical protein